MKKPIPITLVGIFCLFSFILFSGVECNENNDPNIPDDACQDFKSFKVNWTKNPQGAGQKLLDPLAHKNYSDDDIMLLTYQTLVSDKVICTREGTFVDIYLTISKDFQFDIELDGGIVISNNSHNPEGWEKTESETTKYFHGGITVKGDPNGTNADYGIAVIVKIKKKTGSELDGQILEEFNEACHKIEFDWAFTEW